MISHPERYLAAQEILLLGWRAGEHGQGYCLTFK
jgi:hypothetical protein